MSFYGITRTPADKWFSYLVRFHYNWQCVICGADDFARRNNRPDMLKPGPSRIECAHILTRGNSLYNATRHDMENAVALCHACHDSFSHNSEGWERWCRNRLGEKYDLLKLKSRRINYKLKYMMKEFTQQLKEQVIELARNSNRLWIIEKDLTKKDLNL